MVCGQQGASAATAAERDAMLGEARRHAQRGLAMEATVARSDANKFFALIAQLLYWDCVGRSVEPCAALDAQAALHRALAQPKVSGPVACAKVIQNLLLPTLKKLLGKRVEAECASRAGRIRLLLLAPF